MTQDHVPHRTRRRLLPVLIGAAAGAAMIAAACAPAPAPGPAPAGTPPVRLRAPAPQYTDSLREPLTVRSVNGVLSATLDVTFANLPVTRAGYVDAAGDSVVRNVVTTDTLPLRAYSLAATTDPTYDPATDSTPRFPGPTFRVRPGDLVQIWLRNKLPRPRNPTEFNTRCMSYPAADNGRDSFQDCFHGPNYTNIHYHGMHVTPDSTSTVVGDDVLMAIAPGDSILYSFRIPLNQSPGTHWYHPHKHGSVALQVANGMSGAFIVEDPSTGLDRFTRQHNLREHLVGLQQVDTAVGLLHGDQVNILDKVPPLVNGQNYPVIYMAPGEVQRWRIVNENVTSNIKTLEFRFEDLSGQEEPVLVAVARDGVQYALSNIARGNDSLLVAAGNRLDVIVQAPLEAGIHSFQVNHVPGASQRTRRRPALPLETGQRVVVPRQLATDQFDGNDYRVFRVVVDPTLTPSSTGLPASIPNLAAFLGANIPAPPTFLGGDLKPARDTAVIVFTDTAGPGAGHYLTPTQFFLGSATAPFQRFNDQAVFVPSNARGTAMPMILDSTQTWRVVNNTINAINHPFHIHINPFQVDTVAYYPGDPFGDLFAALNAASAAGNPIWLDVLPLPVPKLDTIYRDSAGRPVIERDTAGNPVTTWRMNSGYAVITQRYDPFVGCADGKCGPPTGQFVMHCHILGHEERGMMQVLEIVGPEGRTSAAAGHGGHGAHPPGGSPAAAPPHRH